MIPLASKKPIWDAGISGWDLIYRFVGKDEYDRLVESQRSARLKFLGDKNYLNEQAMALVNGIRGVAIRDDIGDLLFNQTMAEGGGGAIGKSQLLVSFTKDVDALKNTTDPTVMGIIKKAYAICTFQVPKEAVLLGASDLSILEKEVLVVNNLDALGAMLIDYGKNPYASQ